jgi:methylated-DNA-protein-cysteine methyltransferase-like protein
MSPFSSPPDPVIFNHQIWDLVCRIPPGRVATYGQLAKLLPPPPGVAASSYLSLGPRWVGAAMAKCPDEVPWQRVINSKGEISIRPGAEEQRRLLEEEGVEFNAHGRVDLERFGWKAVMIDPDQPHLL